MRTIFTRTQFVLPLLTALFVFVNLSLVQILVNRPMLLAERFWGGAGWIQAIGVAIYAFVVSYHIQDSKKSALWRQRTWFLFSIVFFAQLLLGILVSDIFLMSGNLHLPVPAMILSGPIYRGEISVMTILFLSTIILSGPAWCSHLCYFGGVDNLFAFKRPVKNKLASKMKIKHTILVIVIGVTLLFRLLKVDIFWASLAGLSFGLVGLFIIGWYSRMNGRMIHCILYCPIGTLVNYFKKMSPFTMYIDKDCSACGRCTKFCKYDALNREDIIKHKPSITCTLCGDCVESCHSGSIKYAFFKTSPEMARKIWLFITISLHALTLSLARI